MSTSPPPPTTTTTTTTTLSQSNAMIDGIDDHRQKKRPNTKNPIADGSSEGVGPKKRKHPKEGVNNTKSSSSSSSSSSSTNNSESIASITIPFAVNLTPSAAAWQLVPERMVEVIDEMQVYEDFIWRYFSKRETECRLAVLAKLNALLHHKYHTAREQGGCFVFTTEMFDYYDFVASSACTDTNKQDFLFFCGLAICPEFYQWIEYLHYRSESTYNAPAHKTLLRAHPSNIGGVSSALPLPIPAKVINTSEPAVLAPTTRRTETYIKNHHCRIGNVTYFARFVDHVFTVIRSFTRGRVAQTFNVQPEIDAIVRMLRADYVVQCSLPHPTVEELVIWTRRMRELVRDRI